MKLNNQTIFIGGLTLEFDFNSVFPINRISNGNDWAYEAKKLSANKNISQAKAIKQKFNLSDEEITNSIKLEVFNVEVMIDNNYYVIPSTNRKATLHKLKKFSNRVETVETYQYKRRMRDEYRNRTMPLT